MILRKEMTAAGMAGSLAAAYFLGIGCIVSSRNLGEKFHYSVLAAAVFLMAVRTFEAVRSYAGARRKTARYEYRISAREGKKRIVYLVHSYCASADGTVSFDLPDEKMRKSAYVYCEKSCVSRSGVAYDRITRLSDGHVLAAGEVRAESRGNEKREERNA